MSRFARGLAALGAGLVLALVAAPAYAHDELLSSNPADGSSVATSPSRVVLTFEEPPVALGLQVVVTGPAGVLNGTAPRIEGDTVVTDLPADAPSGAYTVAWRVTSDDGHPVSGSFGFTAQSGPSASASAPPAGSGAPRREPLIPSWAWIIAGVLVIGAAIRVNRQAKRNQRD